MGKINFTVPAGFFEDENPEKINLLDNISNHVINKYQKSFRQNDILLLDISVFELDEDIDLNDGEFRDKSIHGVEGIFKSSNVTASSGFVKNSHLRYYFNKL